MEKVLVNVYVPILATSYDMFIPLNSSVYEVLALIKRAVEEMSYGKFICDKDNVLCYRDNGRIINVNLSVYEAKIKNGSMLILI